LVEAAQSAQGSVVSVQLPTGCAALHADTVAGLLFMKIRSKSGPAPEKAAPVATTVVA
jgi:hypothetical protein